MINNDFIEREIKIHVRELGVLNNRMMKRVMLSTEEEYSTEERPYMVQNNVLTVIVPQCSASIYVGSLE